MKQKSHFTAANLVFTHYFERSILTKDNYRPLKNRIKKNAFLLLSFYILTSCNSETKQQPERPQILHNETHRKYNDDGIQVQKQTDKTVDQKAITETDSLKKTDKMHLVNPILNPIGISLPQQKQNNSSRQRKGKVIYTPQHKKKNQWKRP